MTQATSSWSLAGCLLVLGVFSAIYHPIGSAMLVTHARQLGRDLGWNGVWGNLGAAAASAVTAGHTAYFGWRLAFALPGALCILCGLAFLSAVPGDGEPAARGKGVTDTMSMSRPIALLAVFAVAIVAGGMTFNVTTIAMPKIIDERAGGDISIMMIGLIISAISTGGSLLFGLVLVTAAVYGQVVVNDAMVARYVPSQYRAKAFSVRYFLGFTASGFAAPSIAALHAHGGFPAVLAATACFGAVVFGCALSFRALSSAASAARAVAAE